MIAQDVGPAEIGFPVFKDRSQINIDDIIGLNAADRRVVGSNRQSIGAGPYDTLVPVLLDAELLQSDRIDFLLDLSLRAARPDQLSLFYLVKQLLPPSLRLNQRDAPFCNYC